MLTIIASIQAHPDRVDLVKSELEKLVPVTRAEAGCSQYDLHQDNEDPAHFVFYESWETRDLWQAHLQAPHIAAWRKAADGALAGFRVHELSRVD